MTALQVAQQQNTAVWIRISQSQPKRIAMRNNALLEATLHAIQDNPELHDQTWYFTQTECGTAMCFAGWACHLSGYEPNWDFAVFDAENGNLITSRMGEDGLLSVSAAARDLLGLSREESVILFAPTNTFIMLEQMVKDLVNGDALRDLPDYYLEQM